MPSTSQLGQGKSSIIWFATRIARQRGGKRQMIAVWEAFPYLILGCERWDVDEKLLRTSEENTHQVPQARRRWHGVPHFCGIVGSIKGSDTP